MTFYEFNCLLDRYINSQEQNDWRSGLVAHILANVNRASGHDPFTVEDFMPDRRGKRKTKKQGMSTEAMIAAARAMTIAFGGQIKQKQSMVLDAHGVPYPEIDKTSS